MNDYLTQFQNAITSSGLTPPSEVIADSKLHRFPANGKTSNNSGWYVFHADGIANGVFGDWSQGGFQGYWKADIGRQFTPEEIKIFKAKAEFAKVQAEEGKAQAQAEAKAVANELWNKATLATDHPYIQKKGIKPHNTKILNGELLIPMMERKELQSLQRIKPDGSKRFLAGGKIAGAYTILGGNKDGVICICEGFATGASIHEATGYMTVIAFTAGNLLAVSKVVRGGMPNNKIVICADDDFKSGNIGEKKAIESALAIGASIVLPEFGLDRKDEWTDFNDLAQESGLNAIKKVIEASLQQEQGAILLKASELNPKPIDWIWGGWLAGGKLHLLGGVAGTGKTTISLALASTISNGERFPDGSKAPKGNVVMWSGEDDISDTLTPRLMAMGADLDKVHFVQGIKAGNEERPFDPSSDMPQLKQAIARIGNVKLLIIDPIVSVSNGDSHKNAEVRKDLAPLVQMAESLGFAIIGITHFSKGTSGREPVERITGSLAFGAVARVVLVASKSQNEEGDDVRIFLRAKSNIGSDEGGFEYSLEPATTDNGIGTSKVVWGSTLEGSARDLLGEAEEESDDGGVKGCMCLISDFLKHGSLSATQMDKECKGAGYSISTIKRAKKKLGIKSIRTGGISSKGTWVWEMPKSINSPYEDQTLSVNPLDHLGKNEPLNEESQVIEGEI